MTSTTSPRDVVRAAEGVEKLGEESLALLKRPRAWPPIATCHTYFSSRGVLRGADALPSCKEVFDALRGGLARCLAFVDCGCSNQPELQSRPRGANASAAEGCRSRQEQARSRKRVERASQESLTVGLRNPQAESQVRRRSPVALLRRSRSTAGTARPHLTAPTGRHRAAPALAATARSPRARSAATAHTGT